MFRPIVAATLILSASGMAYADGSASVRLEPMVMQPPPSPESFWTGGYAGGQLGYAYSEFDIDLGTRPGDFDDNSVIGGIHMGYLWKLGPNFLVGPEFQYDFADLEVTDASTGDTAAFNSIARLKMIAGYEVGNGFVYGSAGIAYADFDSVGALFDGIDGSDTNYVVGLGYNHRVGENWSVGGEYMYHHFNNIGGKGEDVSLNTVHVKAAYHF